MDNEKIADGSPLQAQVFILNRNYDCRLKCLEPEPIRFVKLPG